MGCPAPTMDCSAVPAPAAYDQLFLPVAVLMRKQAPCWAAAAAWTRSCFAFRCRTSCCLAQVAPRLPQATEAAGVPLRLWFLWTATTVYVSAGSQSAASVFTCDANFAPTCNVNNMAVRNRQMSTWLPHFHADDGEWHGDWQVR
jgi:hypothetical protein